MKPEDKVCTIEQSKRLVELGVVIETEKSWYPECNEWPTHLDVSNCYISDHPEIKAPGVAELGALLPSRITGKDLAIELVEYRRQYGAVTFEISNICDSENMIYSNSEDTEAQARAAALIWLIENEYLEA